MTLSLRSYSCQSLHFGRPCFSAVEQVPVGFQWSEFNWQHEFADLVFRVDQNCGRNSRVTQRSLSDPRQIDGIFIIGATVRCPERAVLTRVEGGDSSSAPGQLAYDVDSGRIGALFQGRRAPSSAPLRSGAGEDHQQYAHDLDC